MTKIAWIMVIFFILTKLMKIKYHFEERENKTKPALIADTLIVLFLMFCALVVTIDIVKWLYPILH